MKKSNFAALILGTISGIFFALGMCMALLMLIPLLKGLHD